MADDENDLHIGSEFYTCSLYHGYQSDVKRSSDVSFDLGEFPIGEYSDDSELTYEERSCKYVNLDYLQTNQLCDCKPGCNDC